MPIISREALASLDDAVILDARNDPNAYAAGHLRGAIYADPNASLSAATEPGANPAHGGRHPLPDFATWLERVGEWGIGPETNVVVYDDQSGANAAARAWWMFRAIGHERIFVLDGSLDGLPMTTDAPHSTARDPYPTTAPTWLWPTVDMSRVDELREQPDWRVIDVRSAPRYRGEMEPIDPIAGHIPGAVNFPYTDNLTDAHFKSRDELRAQYEAFLRDVPPQRVVVHCGSGVTACHTLLALDEAGLRGASLYVGSWSEWCRNKL